ncbi:MAG: nicotinate-nucleotide--dimethylbenzimidazole phosphoribosyltransferase [Candidatus Omnitrophota bacterium]|nr:nicotinate-nucleotide--dimethylbenzimidazole phosphoribosyltransferase [Candidatus Omnitrophota bacterium]
MSSRLANDVLEKIEPVDVTYYAKAQHRLDNLTKPKGSLGRLEEIAMRIVAISKNLKPSLKRKVIFTMAADHGVCEEGISAYPQEVTPQMVYNFLRGGAGINVLAKHVGAEVIVVDMGVKEKIVASGEKRFKDKKVNSGTKNFAKEQAMSREEALKSILGGIEVFEEAYSEKAIDIVGVGDMGIGNTTASSAIVAAITGEDAALVTGKGTGIDDTSYNRKIEVIKRALSLHNPNPKDPIDVLSKVGGFEIGGIAGVVLAAASKKVPVMVDGFIASCGALIAFEICRDVSDYMIFAHQSVEAGQLAILRHVNQKPLLNLEMRLGEGTGAALGIGIAEAAVKIFNEMATFSEAGVSEESS